ncbi:MAG: sugar phosphate isomerase/epimerase [Bacteroidetes bacterium]|nr:sugar phosphate isomerase/epimerase [Bacteroidota bacterium]
MEQSRKTFIQKAALGIASTISLPLLGQAAFNGFDPAAPEPAPAPALPIGIAGYTFSKFDVEKTIAMMKRLDIHSLSLKDVHLPLNSDDEKIKSVLAAFSAADIKIYTVGVIYMKTKEAVDTAFDYARKVGVDMIVGVPGYDLLDYTEQKVKSTNIRIAIHNHGPEDQLYPGPKDVLERLKGRDARMGLCMDIGHACRTGANLDDAVKAAGSKLFDMHFKDVTLAAKEGKAIEIGRGVINFRSLVKTLRGIGYKGLCSIEFEKDMTDPLPGIAESEGYLKGVIASV